MVCACWKTESKRVLLCSNILQYELYPLPNSIVCIAGVNACDIDREQVDNLNTVLIYIIFYKHILIIYKFIELYKLTLYTWLGNMYSTIGN